MDEDCKLADEAVGKAKSEGFAPGEHKVFVLGRILQRAELKIVGSAVPDETLRDLLLTPVESMELALQQAFEVRARCYCLGIVLRVITIPVLG